METKLKTKRKELVDAYNRAKTKSSKMKKYATLMEFEKKLLITGQNG